jgi:hypothetical protein
MRRGPARSGASSVGQALPDGYFVTVSDLSDDAINTGIPAKRLGRGRSRIDA